MTAPNMFIVYVTDAPASARFYGDLFDMKPVFESPRFIAFDLGGGVQLALWSGVDDDHLGAVTRTSEVCLTIDGGADRIDALHRDWMARGVRIVMEPHDEVFGRTFLATDPDGNLIRVAPVD
ncbi:VOC family protein [Nocardia shimofusensis]|uniref:VOC family protein n=1 Tax=Nocardia shimofusensis TaxID=228596 RepID=UPI00083486F9|nr:VOC family protein [Nocardia shimofusensis]